MEQASVGSLRLILASRQPAVCFFNKLGLARFQFCLQHGYTIGNGFWQRISANIGFLKKHVFYKSLFFRMVLSIVGVIVVVIIGLIGWCIYRFFKKKRPKGAEGNDKQDDENALVDNEEANVEEVSKALQIFALLQAFSIYTNYVVFDLF